MSQVKKLTGTNPFVPLDDSAKPTVAETDYHQDRDDFVIEYSEVDHLISVGDSDTDFVIDTKVEETSRVSRDKLIQSYSGEVGILNIIEKVRKTGDTSLLNQVSRVPLASHEVDSLGRPVEDICDITRYQVDKVSALESFKKGANSFDNLPEDFKGNLSMNEIAHMKDEDILKYFDSLRKKFAVKEVVNNESSK